MANTQFHWQDRDSKPDLSAMSVNDTKQIYGQFASIASCRVVALRTYGGDQTAKKFKVQRDPVPGTAGYNSILVTRTV